jgi:ribosomal protein S18
MVMNRKIQLPLYLLFVLLITACSNNADLDQSAASALVTSYLKANPVYESGKVELGELKFKSKNDKTALANYKDLQDKGFVTMELQGQKKKFLSKDSAYVYLISLTDKSKPYVLKQEQNRATLKLMEYSPDEDQPASLDKSSNKTAKVTVMLKKVKNAFSVFYKDKNTGSNFITKTYKLKYKKETGWAVTGE